jgi:1-aminocyclopropane-1-carboxylate deaminase
MAKMHFTDLNKKINFQLPAYDNLIFDETWKLAVKRFDRMHATINGNKWFKLMFNLEEMNRRGAKQLVTFGGAHSNHIYATAAAAKELGIHYDVYEVHAVQQLFMQLFNSADTNNLIL